ncbi:MAG: TRAM domain-containing protein [Deltaproteobacteria bacterium]|nr:TRAM domain-containing protein [Deltaproteobacteria bacterium]
MKLLLIGFASLSGYFILGHIVGNEWIAYTGVVSGTFIALAALKFKERVNRTPLRIVLGGAIGLITGLIVANLLTYPLVLKFFNNPYFEFSAYIFTNCVLGYIGLSVGMKKGDEFKWKLDGLLGHTEEKSAEAPPRATSLLLDTSVIIDGRIADICKSGFVDGTLIVPQFVLSELQYIADSPDPLKKARGARGLDTLERLQKETSAEVVISREDFPSVRQVDMKLVEFAKKYNAKILTNDVNLNKIAKLHGTAVLNINTLATALKPAILPSEEMRILIVKEGKENGQGVGYLDDGTMVVVDNGINYVGKTIDVSVTSILQTTNGRLIFSRVKEAGKTPSVVRAVT